jgi:hypothetical protein
MAPPAPPPLAFLSALRRFSVSEYQQMIQSGILDENDDVELLEGYVVLKMPRNPPHDGTIQLARATIAAVLPGGWDIRVQSAVTLPDSQPEPDLALARGTTRTYLTRHPGPADLGLIVEVSDSTLDGDRSDKGRIYARAGLSVYWIVNLVHGQLEVYTAPAPSGYGQRQDLTPGASVPLTLDGATVATIAVADLLP